MITSAQPAVEMPGAVVDPRIADRKITFGWELQLDLYDCDSDAISTESVIRDYGVALCKVIDMVPYGEPQTPYFGENCEHTKGYSLLQFIETSSIVGHFSEDTSAAYLNIFSCKAFDPQLAEDFTREYFGAENCVARMVTRE
jgi:S-adenosylmethionine decarboxylase